MGPPASCTPYLCHFHSHMAGRHHTHPRLAFALQGAEPSLGVGIQDSSMMTGLQAGDGAPASTSLSVSCLAFAFLRALRTHSFKLLRRMVGLGGQASDWRTLPSPHGVRPLSFKTRARLTCFPVALFACDVAPLFNSGMVGRAELGGMPL